MRFLSFSVELVAEGCSRITNHGDGSRKTVSLAWSRQEPVPNIINEAALLEGGGMRDRPPHEQHQDSLPPSPAPNPTYFPIAFPRIYGYLPLPPRKLLLVPQELSEGDTSQGTKRKRAPKEVALFPSNLSFEVADWPVEPIPSDYEKYDLILAYVLSLSSFVPSIADLRWMPLF